MPARTGPERDRPHINRASRDSPAGEQVAVIGQRGRPRQNKAEVQCIGIGEGKGVIIGGYIGKRVRTRRGGLRRRHRASCAGELHINALHPRLTRQLVVQVAVEEDGAGNGRWGVVAEAVGPGSVGIRVAVAVKFSTGWRGRNGHGVSPVWLRSIQATQLRRSLVNIELVSAWFHGVSHEAGTQFARLCGNRRAVHDAFQRHRDASDANITRPCIIEHVIGRACRLVKDTGGDLRLLVVALVIVIGEVRLRDGQTRPIAIKRIVGRDVGG